MKKDKFIKLSYGFTLTEIMIVVAVILLVLAIAVPNALRARLNANEAAAISNIMTISKASQGYWTGTGSLPTSLNDLGAGSSPAYIIDSALACAAEPCAKSGYNYEIQGSGGAANFFVYGTPANYQTDGNRTFCAAADGVTRGDESLAGAAPADRTACMGLPAI